MQSRERILKHIPLCVLWGAMLLLSVIVAGNAPAIAQLVKTVRVELYEETQRLHIGPQIYVTEDTEGNLTPQVIASRHQNNLRGQRIDAKMLNFGPTPAAQWLVFSVINTSKENQWVLHFGDVFDGRLGLVKSLSIRNETTGQSILSTPVNEQPGYNLELLHGNALPLSIPPNQTLLFTAYLESGAGLVNTFSPSLMTQKEYAARMLYGKLLTSVFAVFIIALVGFFAAAALIRREYEFLYFSGYFALYGVLHWVLQHNFLIETDILSALTRGLFIAPLVLGMLLSRKFLELSIADDTPNMLVFVGILIMVFSFVSSLFIPANTSSADQWLTFASVLGGSGLLAALSAMELAKKKHGALYLIGGWACAFAAHLFLMFASLHFMGQGGFWLTLYWFMLLPQAGFFIYAALQKIELGTKEKLSDIAKENRAAQSLARLKQSKESADQARLLRVIERERELMAELREREMQRTQEMRVAKETADEANRAKSAFLAVVSHEIRTPMNGIMGMVRLMSDTQMTKTQTEYLQAVQKSGDTMMALLNDILDFEKIESGNMEIEVISFDMARLVEGAVTLMSGHAAEKGLKLKSDIQSDFPVEVRGDPTRLRQVLLNLVNNAIKFTPEGGTVTIILQSTLRDTGADDGRAYDVYCAVQDTGIGISEEAQRNLFNPFTQAEKSTSRKYGGTGLGLAICRNLIEAMGSAIKIKSTEGEGSTFHFTLAMEEGDVDFSENALDVGTKDEEDELSIPPMKILVVDDNEMNRRVLEGFLQKDKHDLVLCGTAEKALQICREQKFDIIITDIRLGGLDGTEFTQKLRQFPDREAAATPVIALSGDVSAEDKKRYAAANMNGFLAKPVDPEALKETLFKASQGIFETDVILQDAAAALPEAYEDDGGDKTESDEGADVAALVEAPLETSTETMPPIQSEPTDDVFDSFDLPEDEGDDEGEGEDDKEEDSESVSPPILQNVKGKVAIGKNRKQKETAETPKEAAPESAEAPSDENLFDPTMMQSLVGALPKDDIDELLKSFTDKNEELIKALEDAAQGDIDISFIRERAHELKGMCANFGLTGVSEIAGRIEKAAVDNDESTIKPDIEKLSDVNQRAQNALQKWLDAQG